MRNLLLHLIIIFIWVAPATAFEYVVNGNFEQPLENGWNELVTDYSGDIFRQTDFDSDSDFEVLLSQDSRAASTLIYQDIPIPDLNLDLSFSAKVYAMSTLPAWAAAMIMIEYFDQDHNLLGDTRFCTVTNYCEWENSTTSHLIEIESEDWEDYTLNLNDEMAYLTEVPPDLIKSIRITAGTVIYDC